ncbi:hypothetical protein CK203_107383 [Vitis vinifera]|uniref:RNase H type-1 domain-containing protein n=1 Tax=Vitis vinifera TaxID=29760 RepID=A0A438ECJ7_VITVI|nr:hypothetical protein CK203_107383 [Vitis vinifera]
MPSSPGRANIFSLCFPDEDFDYGLIVDSRGRHDGVTFDDAYTDEMDMIGISHILDAIPQRPRSAFDLFGVSMLQIDGDDSITDVATSSFISVEGASDPVDPPLFFYFMSRFVIHYDVMFDGNNNDMSLFEYLPMSQHFPLIAPQAPTTTIHDIHDVGDPNDPLSVDFGTSDQPKELKIGSSLSLDERSKLINLLRSYLDVFTWSYEDMLGLDPSIVQHHLPILPHDRPYPEWLANVIPVPKKDHKILMALEDMEKRSFITEWGTYCYRVMPFGLKNAGATDQRAATTLFHDMMHKDVEAYLNPKKSTFGVTSGKLLGHIVSECGIEFDLKKIRVILNMPTPRTKSEIRGFLSRVSSVSIFVSFKHGFRVHVSSTRRLKEGASHLLPERLRHYMIEYSIRLIPRWDLLRCLFDRPVLTGRLMRWLVLLTKFDIQPIDDDFPDEQFVLVASIAGWCLYFDGGTNQSGFGIGILLISPLEYEACIIGLKTALDLGVKQLEIHRDSNLVIQHTQGILRTREEKLKTLPCLLGLIPTGMTMQPLLIETRFTSAYCCLIGDIENQVELPWYHDIHQFLAYDAYPKSAIAKDRRALRQLATGFVISGDALYRRSSDGMLLLCIDQVTIDRVMREVHVGVCGPHMRGHMLAHGDLICVPSSKLHALTSPWPFSAWGVDVIEKVSPKSSSGHEYILVTIDFSPNGWRPLLMLA